MANNAKEKPWLHADGRPKSDKELKEEVDGWSPSDWEEYLKTLEVERAEVLLDNPSDIEKTSDIDQARMLFSMIEQDDFPSLRATIHNAMRQLTDREREIINLRYWENLPRSEIAKALGISDNTVKTYLKRGLAKIKPILKNIVVEMKTKNILHSLPPQPPASMK